MNLQKIKNVCLVITPPIVLAFVLYGVFTRESFGVMSLAFLALVPMVIGALTIYLSKIEKLENRDYVMLMPIAPIFGFFVLTLVLSWEGWGCWIMILPVFSLFSMLGGFLMAWCRLKKRDKGKLLMPVIVFLPILIAPVEKLIGKIPGRYTAYTYIDIQAPEQQIWGNVTRVRAIGEEDNKGWLTRFMGFPRPIKAELDYEGQGGFRKAIFDKGLVFDETVTAYQHLRKMSFSIKANPYNIPSTTMDEHIVIGGAYFDVLDGTYELERLNNNTCRLHLYSHFKLSTSFNFYASWWAGWIMKDIQNNILQVIKKRAEV